MVDVDVAEQTLAEQELTKLQRIPVMQHIIRQGLARRYDATYTCAVVGPEDRTSAGGATSLPAASHKGRAAVVLCSTSTTAVLRLTPSKSQSSPFFSLGAR